MKLTIDNWNRNKNQSSEHNINDASEAIEFLKTLDGKKRTQLILEGENGFLLIGGGNGHYIVSNVIGDNEEFFNLTNPNNTSEEEIELTTGGQAGVFDASLVVGTEAVEKAIQFYFHNQEMEPSLTWSEE